MRPYLKITAIATVLLTSTVGGAFAAHTDHHHQISLGTSVLRDDKSDDDTTFGQTMTMRAPVPGTVATPRLHRIMYELGETAARLDADRADKLLTAVQYHRLSAQEASIQSEAMRISHRYDGRIPTGDYNTLQNQIRHLGTDIGRAA